MPLFALSSEISGASGVSVGIGSFCRFSSSGCMFSSMISYWLGVQSDGSAIWEGREVSEDLRTRVSRNLESEGREDERVLEF